MGKVIITEEEVNKEFRENFNDYSDVDVLKIFELLVHIKEIET